MPSTFSFLCPPNILLLLLLAKFIFLVSYFRMLAALKPILFFSHPLTPDRMSSEVKGTMRWFAQAKKKPRKSGIKSGGELG